MNITINSLNLVILRRFVLRSAFGPTGVHGLPVIQTAMRESKPRGVVIMKVQMCHVMGKALTQKYVLTTLTNVKTVSISTINVTKFQSSSVPISDTKIRYDFNFHAGNTF